MLSMMVAPILWWAANLPKNAYDQQQHSYIASVGFRFKKQLPRYASLRQTNLISCNLPVKYHSWLKDKKVVCNVDDCILYVICIEKCRQDLIGFRDIGFQFTREICKRLKSQLHFFWCWKLYVDRESSSVVFGVIGRWIVLLGEFSCLAFISAFTNKALKCPYESKWWRNRW